MSHRQEKETQILSLLQAIIKRPEMFNVGSVKDIWLIVFGFEQGANYQETLIDFSLEFRIFTNKYFDNSSDVSWEKLIEFHATGSNQSIKLFSVVLNSFLDRDKISKNS